MQKTVRTLFAVTFLLILGIAVSGAQDASDPDDDNPELKLNGGPTIDVPISEMIVLYSRYSGRPVMYDPRKFQGAQAVTVPFDGKDITADEAVRVALHELRYSLVSLGEFDVIRPIAEFKHSAKAVTPEELATVGNMVPVRVVVHLQHANAAKVYSAIKSLPTRQGGLVQAVSDADCAESLLICDFAENVRRIIKVVRELDAIPATISQVIQLANRKTEEIETTLTASSGGASIGFDMQLNIVVVTGKPSEVARVAEVIAALDVVKPK